MTLAYIAAGSNLGDRQAYLENALTQLSAHPSITIRKTSPNYETDPVGYLPQEKFLNAVWEIETELSCEDLLEELRRVENEAGRTRTIPNGPRTLDLDLLAHGNAVVSRPELTLPHPRLHERAFVLKPFADVNPDWVHPLLNRSVRSLLAFLEKN